ncbi:MAG: DNA/RNA non-specific endonuclease [Novosphingobium sp.]
MAADGGSAARFARNLVIRDDVEESIDIEAVETPGAVDERAVTALLPQAVPAGVSHDEVAQVARKIVSGSEPLDDREQYITEAIIIPDKRPAVDVINGDFAIDHPLWTDYAAGPAHAAFIKALPSVGRIELPGHPSMPYGGTGFVVGKGLVMTNRHVAQIFAEGLGQRGLRFLPGLGAGIDFLRERGRNDSQPFAVAKVVMIHPFWDMALLKVDGLDGHPPLTLSSIAPPPRGNRRIAVIGYPAFDPRNDAAVQDQVFGRVYNVKRFQPGLFTAPRDVASFGKKVPAACHDSSTLGGNSGSVVLDAQTGQVIGLHFAGVYKDSNFAVPASALGMDGRVIDAGVQIEGGGRRASGAWDQWWARSEAQEQPVAGDGSAAGNDGDQGSVSAGAGTPPPAPPPPAPPPPPVSSRAGSTVFTIPLRIEVSLGDGGGEAGAVAIAPAVAAEEALVEPQHDDVEVERAGYQADFLGAEVPLPTPRRPRELATLDDGGWLVPYHHFSLAMHKRRRLALFTAANVDARPAAKTPEPGRRYTRDALGGLGANDQEKWFSDPRLRGTEQLPDKFFTKDRGSFDKGHIVRREDVAWGATYAEVQAANGDTFFTTNCSPQVAKFNRSNHADNWGALEDLVAKQGRTERYCLFAGPVLKDSDRIFAGTDERGAADVRIPQAYWKVVVAHTGGKLQVYAFVLKQDLSDTDLEFSVPAQWKRQQVSLKALEDELGSLDFADELHAADRFGK